VKMPFPQAATFANRKVAAVSLYLTIKFNKTPFSLLEEYFTESRIRILCTPPEGTFAATDPRRQLSAASDSHQHKGRQSQI